MLVVAIFWGTVLVSMALISVLQIVIVVLLNRILAELKKTWPS